jgi:glycerol-3-phosphate dehydrogenase (NAD(P)+)
MAEKLRICVLGGGSWGTTLAILLAENEHDVTLWEYFKENAEAIQRDGENKKFLPGVPVPSSIRIETDLGAALGNIDIAVFVVPSHVVRATAKAAAASGHIARGCVIVNAAKGLEEGSLKRMSEVLAEESGAPASAICTLSGPSHAEEVSRQMPTSVVVAGSDRDTMRRVQDAFMRPYFRVYTNPDLVGVEIGVALKNIIAIAAGICDGLGYGDNTKAALLTRGLVELMRIGTPLGAQRETFFGLAGIGDLIATSLSRHSRNRYVGERIGKGEPLEKIVGEMVMVAEGVRTTRAAVDMAKRLHVDLPIIRSVYDVLYEGKNPREAINELMNRPPQPEMNWMQSDARGGSS